MLPSPIRAFCRTNARLAQSAGSKQIAVPHAPTSVRQAQAPNRDTIWSADQAKRTDAMVGPRFEQTAEQYQPRPLAAIELIAEQPIRLVKGRVAMCDGGGGALGHPKIFVNLDRGAKACNYCGIRFEQDHEHH